MASFIENQEAVIAKIEEKRGEFTQLIKRGQKLEGQADCPPFLKERVKGLTELFEDSEEKAKKKLETLHREYPSESDGLWARVELNVFFCVCFKCVH